MKHLSPAMAETVIAFLNEDILGIKAKKQTNSFYGFGFKSAAPRPFLTPKELASALAISVTTLDRLRNRGDGPPFVKIGNKRIRYSIVGLDDWVRDNLTNHDAPESNSTDSNATESN